MHCRRLSREKWELVFVLDKTRDPEMDVEIDEFFEFKNEPKEVLDEKYRRFVDERRALKGDS